MFLGLDLGTSSIKALILRRDGNVLAEAVRAYEVNSPQAGWAESEPRSWLAATYDAVKQLPAELRKDIEAIGFSGQMHGVVLSDEHGEPLRPSILWADTRSTSELSDYLVLTEHQRRNLGNPLTVGMMGPTLLWLRKHESRTYRAARWTLQPKDWLRLILTGEVAGEPSDASATLLYDLECDAWALDLLESLGLRRETLAPLCKSSAIAGTLRPEPAAEMGLEPGLPVAAGAGDAAASALGSGLTRVGQVQANLGTAMQIFAIREQASIDPSLRTHLYRDAGQGYYAMAAMQNGGLALEWVRRMLGLNWSGFYEAVFAAPPGSEGVSFLPYLSGERTPHLDPEARGSWSGLALRHGRAHLARAAFEGVAFALKDGFEALRDTGIEPTTLRLAGGGSLDPRWRQLLADVLELPLAAVSAPSASARGAALLAGMASGAYADFEELETLFRQPETVALPRPDARLRQAYLRFRRQYPALNPQSSAGTSRH